MDYSPRSFTAVALAGIVISCIPLVQGGCPHITNEMQCTGHGDCDKTQCQCWDGWSGVDCSQRFCPLGEEFTIFGMEETECSGRGSCDRKTGKCRCHPSWSGNACQRLKCGGGLGKCNNRGFCQSIQSFTDSMGHDYGEIWDAEQIYGCVCNPGFGGYDCSEYKCPHGDDPLTTGQFTEIKILQCSTDDSDPTFKIKYQREEFTARGDWTVSDWEAAFNGMLALTTVQVTFSDEDGLTCQSASNAIMVEFVQDFGHLDSVRVEYPSFSDGGKVEVAEGGGVLAGQISRSVTKESLPCSGRGLCDPALGYCQCYLEPLPGYFSSDGHGNSGLRGDCGTPDWKIPQFHCPGEVACSGHGHCEGSPTYKCSCQEGWGGGDCSERTCGVGWSWFPLEYSEFVSTTNLEKLERPSYALCSNRGICDRVKGECLCQAGFSGINCEQMNLCGSDPTMPCGGHGQCVPMTTKGQLQKAKNPLHSDDLEEVSPWIVKHYGDNILKCECEPGYSGWDCSQRECLRGDDPNTVGQFDEIQLFECNATTGSFRLSFRDESTQNVAFDASASELQSALEALTTIEAVKVDFSNPGSGACHNMTSGLENVWSVTFLTEYGDLPPLIPQLAPPEDELGYNCFSICYATIPYVELTADEEVLFTAAEAETPLEPSCATPFFNDTEPCYEHVCGTCSDSSTICTACIQPNELDLHDECGIGDVPFHYCAKKSEVMQLSMITNKYKGPPIPNFSHGDGRDHFHTANNYTKIGQRFGYSLKSFYAPPHGCPDTLSWGHTVLNETHILLPHKERDGSSIYTPSTSPSPFNFTFGDFIADTFNFTNPDGKTCTDYYEEGWCCDGAACPSQDDYLGAANNYPEENCCVCGKTCTNAKNYTTSYTSPKGVECRAKPPVVLKTMAWWAQHGVQEANARAAAIGSNSTDDFVADIVDHQGIYAACELDEEAADMCGAAACGTCRLERQVIFSPDSGGFKVGNGTCLEYFGKTDEQHLLENFALSTTWQIASYCVQPIAWDGVSYSADGTDDQSKESIEFAIDGNSSTAYVSTGGGGTGLEVYARRPAVINGLAFVSAGDNPTWDPTSFILQGGIIARESNGFAVIDSNGELEVTFTEIVENDIPIFSSRLESSEMFWFENEISYDVYRVVFATIVGSSLDSMQIGSVQFWNRHPTIEGVCHTCIQPNELDPHQPACGEGDIPFHYCDYNSTSSPTLFPTVTATYSPTVSTCINGEMDGDETDEDCGGSCQPCAPGYHCLGDSDCADSVCADVDESAVLTTFTTHPKASTGWTTSANLARICNTRSPTAVPTPSGCEDALGESGEVFVGGRGTLATASETVADEIYTCAALDPDVWSHSDFASALAYCASFGNTDYNEEGTINDKCCACGGGVPVELAVANTTSALDRYVIDNDGATGVTLIGDWASSTTNDEYWGTSYLHDLNFQKGYKTAIFTPTIAISSDNTLALSSGALVEYFTVYVWYTAASNRGQRVLHTVEHADGKDEFYVNQESFGGRWVQLGSFRFLAGILGWLEISNSGTTQDGYVIADAVMFRRGIFHSKFEYGVTSTCGCNCGTGGTFCGDFTISPTPSPAVVDVSTPAPFVWECPLPVPYRCERQLHEFFVPGQIAGAYNGQSLGGLTSREGSREDYPCSNRGLCDYDTGQCTCARDYSRSFMRKDDSVNGGEFRIREDCGRRSPQFNPFA